jgi:hypothetical protein
MSYKYCNFANKFQLRTEREFANFVPTVPTSANNIVATILHQFCNQYSRPSNPNHPVKTIQSKSINI